MSGKNEVPVNGFEHLKDVTLDGGDGDSEQSKDNPYFSDLDD